jgi:hypothetical protein
MSKYNKKFKSLEDIVSKYELLQLRVGFLRFSEAKPRAQSFKPIHSKLTRFKAQLHMPLTYFDIRFLLTPETKKTADLLFISHYRTAHIRGAELSRTIERFHYKVLSLKYWAEFRHVNNVLHTMDHPDLQSTEHYVIRWQYMGNVNQEFEELIHGTDIESAFDWVEDFLSHNM